MKKAVKVIVCLVLALVLIVIGYLAYVLIDYHRIGNEVIDRNPVIAEKAEVNKEYDMVSWNIGFGAYESDYGFFMDGVPVPEQGAAAQQLGKNRQPVR